MLRDYQQAAVDAALAELEAPQVATLLIAPTGSGKSHIIAEIIKSFAEKGKSVLVVSHVKEILSQDAEKVMKILPGAPIAFYSASFRQKRFGKITFATIQSLARAEIPHFDLLIIDEAHLVPSEGMGNYQKLIKKLSGTKILGLTATPYRLDSGVLFGKDQLFQDVCFEIPMLQLVFDGYLSPLISKRGIEQVDVTKLKKSGKDFNLDSINEGFDDYLIDCAVREIIGYGIKRKSWLVFCSSIKHAERVNQALCGYGVKSSMVSGETLPMMRDQTFQQFKAQEIQCLVGCEIFTTGFDAPAVDLIALLRPTMSAGLYVQMLGRGSRIADGKENCLVLDYAGNIERHGAVDKVRVTRNKKKGTAELESSPVKFCPECRSANKLSARECIDCGFEFHFERGINHEATASDADAMSKSEVEVYHVLGYTLCDHVSKGGVNMLRIDFEVNQYFSISAYMCFERPGKLRLKAKAFWQALKGQDPVPASNQEAIERQDELAGVRAVHFTKNGKFYEIQALGLEEEETDLYEEAGVNI
jgi:DNA repair protein RadD